MTPANQPRLLRVVIDPNVLVSAFISDLGSAAAIHDAWTRHGIEFIVAPQLLAEMDQVLLRPKFRRYGTEERAREFVDRLREATFLADPPPQRVVPADEGDDYLMALAKYAGADYALSGDSDLTALTNTTPPVVTPRGLYALLVERGLAPARNSRSR